MTWRTMFICPALVLGMHLAVVPAARGRGHGAWLMHEVGPDGYCSLNNRHAFGTVL